MFRRSRRHAAVVAVGVLVDEGGANEALLTAPLVLPADAETQAVQFTLSGGKLIPQTR